LLRARFLGSADSKELEAILGQGENLDGVVCPGVAVAADE
jgi:hypothetical protein